MSDASELSYLELYRNISESLRKAADERGTVVRDSGFADPAEEADTSGVWQPIGALPDRFVDRKSINLVATFEIFGDMGFIGIESGGFTQPWERRIFGNTEQRLTVVLNGTEAIDVTYPYDGREGWSYAKMRLPASLPASEVKAVEIENNGRLLLSKWTSPPVVVSDYKAKIGFISKYGFITGGATAGADSKDEVLVELSVGGTIMHVMTEGPFFGEPLRKFEVDVSEYCADGHVVKISLKNLFTEKEAKRSPVGVFQSDGNYFLVANPILRDEQIQLTLRSHRLDDNKPLSLATYEGDVLEILCEINLPDIRGFRFLDGTNTFRMPVAALAENQVLIVEEGVNIVGRLPALNHLLDVMGPVG